MPEQPIVYRAKPGERVTIYGQFVIHGAYTWIWGMEMTSPSGEHPTAGGGRATPKYEAPAFLCRAAGVHLINNIIHDAHTENAIGGWNEGPDHVYYGNIIYRNDRAYPIYTQNRFETAGVKYIVQNMFLDVRQDSRGSPFNVHAYTEENYVSGFYFRQDIVSRGRFLLGGNGYPTHHNTVEQCVFYDAPEVQIGWGRPAQVVFHENYLARSFADFWMFWINEAKNPHPSPSPVEGRGVAPTTAASQPAGEASVEAKPIPNVVTGNYIVLPPEPIRPATVDKSMNPDAVHYAGLGVLVRTAYVPDKAEHMGEEPLDWADTFDDNHYYGIFRGLLYAAGKLGTYDLPGWRKATAAAGKELDANSSQEDMPQTAAFFVFANEYEPGRAHVAIVNWPKVENVRIDLSPAVKKGEKFRMMKARDPFGPPVVEGLYKGSVSVPMGREEFGAFLVLPGAR